MKIYNAINLIDKIIELEEISPNVDNWNPIFYSSAENSIEFILLRQVIALSNAINAKFTPANYKDGSFLKTIDVAHVSQILSVVKPISETLECRKVETLSDFEIRMMYGVLLGQKRKIYNLLDFNRGLVMGSEPIFLISVLNEQLHSKVELTHINAILQVIVDPLNLQITEDELINLYGFLKDSDKIINY